MEVEPGLHCGKDRTNEYTETLVTGHGFSGFFSLNEDPRFYCEVE